jgi:CO/xanthine dehydrogenase FAD-binding subunit
VPDLALIRRTSEGGLSIGALARLSRIAEDPTVAGRYPLLVQAADCRRAFHAAVEDPAV